MTTRDPLYWGLILVMGLLAGIFAYHFDRQDKQKLGFLSFVLYLLVSLLGAVVGAHVFGPALQVTENFIFRSATAEIKWPSPVSMNGFYLFIGTAAGTMLFNTVVRLFCRGTGSR